MKKVLFLICVFFLGQVSYAHAWINDARGLFLENRAIALTVNLRTFNANDVNGNGIIEVDKGETKGNFINAIDRLDEIQKLGVNTVHLLPITPIGKRKSFGTAGSLFAMSDFSTLNSQLISSETIETEIVQARRFIKECHNKNIRVIVEVPAYGAYDLYIKKGKLFLKDKKSFSVIPDKLSDVRIFKYGDEDSYDKLVYNEYKDMMDMFLSLDVDGVVVNEPSVKSLLFWQDLISYVKDRNSQFVFLAEMFPEQKKSVSKLIKFIPLEKLLRVGFDGYFYNFKDISEWKFADDLYVKLEQMFKYQEKFKNTKSVIGAFSMYDTISPVVSKGIGLSKLIVWLNATLPMNSIYPDGFQSGDDYSFEWANLKAYDSQTDCDSYYVNRGRMDIYNFSRKPQGVYKDLTEDFYLASKLKDFIHSEMHDSKFIKLKTNHSDVLAYALSDRVSKNTVVVIANLNVDSIKNIEVSVQGLKRRPVVEFVKNISVPEFVRGKIYTMLGPYDIQVLKFSKFALN